MKTGQDTVLRLIALAESLCKTIQQLVEEKDQLRKDAERYRWLRDKCSNIDIQEGFAWISQNYETLDEAIDVEMKQKE